MTTALQRGIVLYGQGRCDLAEREFRQALAEDPNEFLGHAFLSLCLADRNQDAESLVAADEAVRLAPDASLAHSVRGRALLGLKRLREAESSAREAIRLDPDNADYRTLLGHVAMARSNWPEALDAADQSLALDAQHLGARNLRAMALTQLGRKAEAEATLGEALAEDPEDAVAHANQGWVSLHKSDPDKALEHFREALRLDPTMEWARLGIVEALKARHLIYRLMLRFFLWMGRQTQAAQWAVVLALVIGPNLLASVAKNAPNLQPFVMPIKVAVFTFVILTWIASPLFNFLLRFNRFGRLALSDEQRVESSWIGGCAVMALACAAIFFATGSAPGFFGMAAFGLILFPLTVTFNAEPGRPRLIAALATAGLFLLNVPLMSILLLGTASPFRDGEQALNFFRYFLYGSMLSTWLPMVLRSASSMR
jgi:tetratricopeptide (TPR) repeat protein